LKLAVGAVGVAAVGSCNELENPIGIETEICDDSEEVSEELQRT